MGSKRELLGAPEVGWNCRFSIADCRLTAEEVAAPPFQSAISNRQ
jgi:hypothetical protein